MNYTFLTILTVIVMVVAFILTARIGSTLKNDDSNSTYSNNVGRKWTRLIMLYIIGIVIVIGIFLYMMD